jgi:tRNA pseudouridine38-40 synthase
MRNGAYALIGEHDFVAWCKSARKLSRPTTRRVFDVAFRPSELGFDIAIWANSFCQQMVRSVVGSLVEIGRGRRSGAYLRELLVSGARHEIGLIAPPEGLYLYEVGFCEFDGGSVERWMRYGFDPLQGGMGLWSFPV